MRYPVTSAPPLADGALHTSATLPSPNAAETSAGAPGTVAGVAERSFDLSPSPAALTAATS